MIVLLFVLTTMTTAAKLLVNNLRLFANLNLFLNENHKKKQQQQPEIPQNKTQNNSYFNTHCARMYKCLNLCAALGEFIWKHHSFVTNDPSQEPCACLVWLRKLWLEKNQLELFHMQRRELFRPAREWKNCK